MRRALILLPASLLLFSCAGVTRSLQPSEVLDRSSQATRTLQSVRFAAQGRIFSLEKGMTASGSVLLDGVVQQGGTQLQLHARVTGTTVRNTPFSAFEATLIVPSPGEVDIRIMTASGSDPLLASDSLKSMRGKWYVLKTASAALSIAPDPRILQAQSEVVRVTADHGRESLGNDTVYHYDTVIDTAKFERFLQAVQTERGQPFDASPVRAFFASHAVTGEIWIDSDSYVVRRLRWTVTPAKATGFAADILFSFSDQNDAQSVTAPEDVQPIPASLLQSLLQGSASGASRPPAGGMPMMNSLFLDQ